MIMMDVRQDQVSTQAVPVMNNGSRTRVVSDITLLAVLTALSCSSMFVQYTMRAWRLQVVVDRVEAIADQLVQNAVKTTGIMEEHVNLTKVKHLNLILVRLRLTDTAVVVEVWDSSEEPPRKLAPVGYQSGFFMAERGGKVVWTAVPYVQPDPAPLPRRKPSPFAQPVRPLEVMHDPEMFRRVRDGLKDL